MGRTYKRNSRWKKDKRDKGFRESKKFKEQSTDYGHRPNQPKDVPKELDDLENDY